MCEVAEVEAFGRGIGRAEEALHTFAEVLRANEEGFGIFSARLNKNDSGAGRESGEEVFVIGGVEFLAAIEVEHGVRILPSDATR